MHNQTMRTLALLALVPLLSSKASIAAKRQSGGTVALVNVRVVSMNPDDRVSRQLNLGTEARGTPMRLDIDRAWHPFEGIYLLEAGQARLWREPFSARRAGIDP